MHPARRLLEWLPELDFALFGHGFREHGRDYFWQIQDLLGADPGEHELLFTHCVQADCRTSVRDEVWARSWDDVFLSHEGWIEAGEPNGYVWGSNWSLAYPGLTIIEDSVLAAMWSERIGRPFFEVTLETDRFFIRLIFHDIIHRKVSASTAVTGSVLFPL